MREGTADPNSGLPASLLPTAPMQFPAFRRAIPADRFRACPFRCAEIPIAIVDHTLPAVARATAGSHIRNPDLPLRVQIAALFRVILPPHDKNSANRCAASGPDVATPPALLLSQPPDIWHNRALAPPATAL